MDVLTPAIPQGVADNARPILRMHRILQNPMAMYSPAYFRRPIMTARAGSRFFAQVMDPVLAETILKNPDVFGRSEYAQRFLKPALGDGLLTAEGESWRPQRRAASPAFRAKALDRLVPTFTFAGAEMAARLTTFTRQTVDVAPETTRATFDVIARTLLHGRDDTAYEQARFADDITLFMSTIGRLSIYELFPFLGKVFPRRFFVPGYRKGQGAITRLRGYAEEIVEARLAAGEIDDSDLMGLMIAAEDPESGDKLTPSQLVDNALTFVGAGHETTAVALSWTFYLIAHSQNLQDELAEEVQQIAGDAPVTAAHLPKLRRCEAVLKEAMRLFPPVPVIPRTIREKTELAGLTFNPGDHVSIGIYPMHRHQRLWKDPDSFRPDRFLEENSNKRHRFQYLPFGGGPRICIGMRFAIMEGVAMLAETIRKVSFSIPGGFEPEPYLAITMRPRTGMPLKVSAR